MKAPLPLRPRDFAHAPAPLSGHEWQCKEEERERSETSVARRRGARGDAVTLAHPFGQPMKQLLDGTRVPE
jgi:hypothetical protein